MQNEKKSGVERLLEWARNWVVPILFFAITASSSGTAVWVYSRNEQRMCAHEIVEIRAHIDRLDACLERLEAAFNHKHAIGSDGFSDDVLHGRMDRHLEHWMVERLGGSGWRKLQRDYSTTASGPDR